MAILNVLEGKSLLILVCWEFSSWMNFAEWISQNDFSACFKMITGLSPYSVNAVITLIFEILSQPRIPQINPTGLPVYRWINLLIFCYWISCNTFFCERCVLVQVHERYWSVLFCNFFVWFWYQGNAGLKKRDLNVSLLYFLREYELYWYYFSLISFTECTSEAIGNWSYVCRKVYDLNNWFFTNFRDMQNFYCFLSQFDNVQFSRNLSIYLSCQIYGAYGWDFGFIYNFFLTDQTLYVISVCIWWIYSQVYTAETTTTTHAVNSQGFLPPSYLSFLWYFLFSF